MSPEPHAGLKTGLEAGRTVLFRLCISIGRQHVYILSGLQVTQI
jgi:hypothetical protein